MEPVEMIEIKLWAIVNADGEYDVGVDWDEVLKRWTDEDGGYCLGLPQRCMCVTVRLPKPTGVIVVAELPAEPTDGVKVKVV